MNLFLVWLLCQVQERAALRGNEREFVKSHTEKQAYTFGEVDTRLHTAFGTGARRDALC